ncbi:nucleotidyltransferase domain-containing protein [Sediminibacillus dalangtanensis]|uniref:Nucleotidyltransferase domain-containing protein n=1 Tax=Sediminibacillus dalangtanensis TaxID=2729421 RepID=A0ABX7VUQ4_9BACI|nr:nucleotidyltransferase domain-containing protein [Sediminibacillus dalangtanensis]QTN00688.1 nucleotidyltransferase domain-containing protein [Sediminibacillus dalangtanensis]
MNSHERTLNELKRVVEKTMPHHDVTVYLFGSWARMQQKQSSDIDIAIDAERPISPALKQRLLDALENSKIPYHIDVVELAEANDSLKQNILQEGVILWKDSNSDFKQQRML